MPEIRIRYLDAPRHCEVDIDCSRQGRYVVNDSNGENSTFCRLHVEQEIPFLLDLLKPGPVTISQLADAILGRQAATGADFEEAGVPMLGRCEVCHASTACYNSYPSKTGYLRCEDCIGDLGFLTVAEAHQAIFDRPLPSKEVPHDPQV